MIAMGTVVFIVLTSLRRVLEKESPMLMSIL